MGIHCPDPQPTQDLPRPTSRNLTTIPPRRPAGGATNHCYPFNSDRPTQAGPAEDRRGGSGHSIRNALLGVLDPDFVARFRAIAGFRDLLVHGYIEVDIPRLHQLLNQRLDDFAEFAAKITAHLDRVQ